MEKELVPLALVSSEADVDSARYGLCRSLVELGYRVQLYSALVWISHPPPQIPTVVLLKGDPQSDSVLSNMLQRCAALPLLAVLCEESLPSDTTLAEYCQEFVCWPCDIRELRLRMHRVENVWHRTELPEDTLRGVGLVARSAAFQRVVERLEKFARCYAPVLIQGETGTGKEIAARAVHYLGDRRDFPFVPVNCGAIPDDLVENELFGHCKGAFTDARETQVGLVEQAAGGTLFLDEIGTLSRKAQAVLLRFLQNQEYRQLGGEGVRIGDVRIIAATNADLSHMVEEGSFRQDLLFRLNIMSVSLPPMRDRREDIEALANHFIEKYRLQYRQPRKRFHPDTLDWFQHYSWPGNVREMENVIHREFLLAEGLLIRVEPPPGETRSATPVADPDTFDIEDGFNRAKARAVECFEREYLSRLLAECGGNVTAAALRSGKERRALGKLLKKHGIDRSRFRGC